jgi:septal ring factor EnvC (AmiA/AmiB activator)
MSNQLEIAYNTLSKAFENQKNKNTATIQEIDICIASALEEFNNSRYLQIQSDIEKVKAKINETRTKVNSLKKDVKEMQMKPINLRALTTENTALAKENESLKKVIFSMNQWKNQSGE